MVANFGMGAPDYASLNMTPEERAAQYQQYVQSMSQAGSAMAADRSQATNQYWAGQGATSDALPFLQPVSDDKFGSSGLLQGNSPQFDWFNNKWGNEIAGGPGSSSYLINQKTNEYNTTNDLRAQEEARQKQAYQQQQGGSATGGMLPAAYSTPFDGQVTGQPNDQVNMPYNQPWGTPGFGGPTGGASIDQYGGLGGLGGMKSSSAWGGPFGVKNPFAPS